MCVCVRAQEREGYERTWSLRDERERKRERKRWRRRFQFRPSGNRTRSPPFLVFDPRQILPCPRQARYVLLRVFLLHFVGSHPASVRRLLPRRPYAKCIYVLCKASNRRWPREPDAHCVINTDALVVPLPLAAPLTSSRLFVFSGSASSLSPWPGRADRKA